MAFNPLTMSSRLLIPVTPVSKLDLLKKKWFAFPDVSKILLEALSHSGFGDPKKWKEADADIIEALLDEALRLGPRLEKPSWFYDLQRAIGLARFSASLEQTVFLNEMLIKLTRGPVVPKYPEPDIVIRDPAPVSQDVEAPASTPENSPDESSTVSNPVEMEEDPPNPIPVPTPQSEDMETEEAAIPNQPPLPSPPIVDEVEDMTVGVEDLSIVEDASEQHQSSAGEPAPDITSSVGNRDDESREESREADLQDLSAGLGAAGGSAIAALGSGLIPAATVATAYPRPDQFLRDYLARYDQMYPSGSRYPPRWEQLKSLYDKGMTVKEVWDLLNKNSNNSNLQAKDTDKKQTAPSSPSAPQESAAAMASGDKSGVNPSGGSAPLSATVWASGAQFEADHVITHMSRTVFIPFQQAHRYEPIVWRGRRTADGWLSFWPDHPVIGYKTPWFYLDVNAINRHFSPGEWQEVLERYGSIVPESMEIILSDFCIKDVSVVDGKTTVTDSSTGGVCVFVDDGYKFPYVLGHSQNTLPGPLPTDIYSPPQYAYLTTGKKTKVAAYASGEGPMPMDSIAIPSQETAFYVLENSFYTIQRAGGGFAHSYNFPSLKPISLEGFSQHWMLMDNPLYPSRLWVPEKVGGASKWGAVKNDDYGKKPLNWMPGPNIPSHTIEQSDQAGQRVELDRDVEGQKVWTGTSFGSRPENRWSMRPLGVNQPYAYDAYEDETDKIVTVDAIGYGTAKASAALGQDTGEVPENASVGRVPDDTECNKQGGGGNHLFQVKSLAHNNFTEQMKNQTVPLMPGSVWQNRALHYESQIWAKIPNVDGEFMCERPALGGWGMHDPPPQIFMKMQPVPAPKSLNSTTEAGFPSEHYLHQYAYCVMTVRMRWKTTTRTGPTRWNPQPTFGPPEATDHIPYILYDRLSTIHKTRGQFTNAYYEEPESVWTARGRVRHL
nr:structural protein [Bovine parvovirus 3]